MFGLKLHFFHLSLRSQLLILMLLMMIVSFGSLMYFQKLNETKIVNLVEEEISGLTTAMEISVEQITTNGSTNEDRLKSYYEQLKKKGVEEISILSDKQEVIESTNPNMIGSRVSVGNNEFIIFQKIGNTGGDDEPKKIYKAFVPVVSGGELKGYVHVSMYFDDLDMIIKEMFYKRAFWIILVFGIGVLISIVISYRYTKPISLLIEATRSISQGTPPVLPALPGTEIGNLADSFKNMVDKLEEQKSMEEKLKRAEHNTMLAQLASGVAHEIRNPLNFISLSVDHLKTLKSIQDDNEFKPLDLINRMKTEVKRVNQMVINFLDLGRELILHPILIRADLPVEEILEISGLFLKERNITVEKEYEEPMPELEIDIDKMKSCFSNIINNAIDSMAKGGFFRISIRARDGLIIYTFEDSGEGIQQENFAKIYEPYFTTKKTGTGLGLAITKRIVEGHMGDIRINSIPGHGTNVQILLPAGKGKQL